MKQVSKNELAHALNALGKLVCRTSPVEAYRCIRLQGQSGKLTLSVVSPKETLQVDLPAEGEEAFDAVVLFASLKDAIKGGGTGNVTFSVKEDVLYALVTGTRASALFPFPLMKMEWPTGFQAPADAKSVPLPDGFVAMLAQAAPIVDRANYRRILQGIHLCEEGIVATNGKELLHLPLALDGVNLTIPFPLALLAARESQGGMLQVWQSDTLDFSITLGPWRWSGEALPGTYPNWRMVVPKQDAYGNSVTFAEESAEAVSAYLKRTAGENFTLRCKDEGALVVSALHDPEQAIEVPVQFKGEPKALDIALARTILEHLLQGGHRTIAFGDNHAPILATGDKGNFVAMPIYRASSPATQPKTNEPTQTEESKMNESTHVVAANVPQAVTTPEPAAAGNPMDELGSAVEEFKQRIKAMFEESSALSRKVKEVSLQQKQKERDFILAKRAIERIRMAI